MVRGIVEHVVKAARAPDVGDYWQALAAEAKKAKEAGNTDDAAKLHALSDACNMMLASEDARNPFRPLAEFGDGQTTATPQTLSEQDYTTIREFTTPETDPELRARCADLLWVAKRDRPAANVAIESYVESTKRLYDPKHWVEPMKRIERAYRLARMLGDRERLRLVSDYIKSILDKHDGTDPLYFTTRLLELLAEHKDGDAPKYAALAEKAAKNAAKDKDHRRARGLWEIAARWHGIQKQDAAKDAAQLAAARTYIDEADERASAGDPSVESAHLSWALTALKRARADPKEVEAVHKRLLESQKASRAQMGGVGTTINLTEEARKAREAVKGKTLPNALGTLAFLHPITDVKQLRADVEQSAKDFPLQYLFPHTVVNNVGKVVAKIPSLIGAKGTELEEAMMRHMVKRTALGNSLVAVGIVAPAREIINQEHAIEIRDLIPLVQHNPFVPPGRERIYARGIHEGLTGDLETSLHILAPQIENSIRFVLETHGAIVSRHDDDGIQQEIALHNLMETKEFEDIFGPDLTFELKSLLVNPVGSNFRNRIAHGLAASRELNSSNALYLWWIALRLLFIGHLATQQPEPTTDDEVEIPEENIREVPSEGDDEASPPA